MSKRLRQASWTMLVALLVIAGYGLSSNASTDPTAARFVSAEIQGTAQTADAEAQEAPVPQATCSAIKCPPGQVCINSLQCTPAGDCFHVGRCVSLP